MPKTCTICNNKPAKYGVRVLNGPASATHCSDCNNKLKPKLPSAVAKLCTRDLGNGDICPKQSKTVIDGCHLCGEHSKAKKSQKLRSNALPEDERIRRRKIQHLCIIDGCERSKQYGYQSDRKRRVCSRHVPDLEVRSDDPIIGLIGLCKMCKLRPAKRTLDNGTRSCIECADGKGDKLAKPKCKITNCHDDAKCGIRDRISGVVPADYCIAHSTDNMARSQKQLCKYQDDNYLYQCDKRAGKGHDSPLYCSQHADDEHKDVVHKMCEVCGDVRPTYGYGNVPTHCDDCKRKIGADDMPDLVSYLCQFNDKHGKCGNHARFGDVDGKRVRCHHHSENHYMDVTLGHCRSCTDNFATPRLNGECRPCFIANNPSDPRVTRIRVKERLMLDAISAAISFTGANQQVRGGTSKRRPDAYIRGDEHDIIIEIDENEHRSYNQSVETLRINQLSNDFQRPIVVIRINPDGPNSPFGEQEGAIVISNDIEFNRRTEIAIRTTRQYLNQRITENVTTVKLFFSE